MADSICVVCKECSDARQNGRNMRQFNAPPIRIIVVTFCTVAIIWVVCLCVKHTPLSQDNVIKSDDATKGLNISEDEAIEIAKQEIRKRETWNSETECSVSRTKDGCNVMVWRLPKVPGGHRLIEISNKGEVLDYIIGK